MSQASGLPLEELRQYMFLYHDREATEHIMRVSGGLDSLVMGEGQILAQVPTHPRTYIRGHLLNLFTTPVTLCKGWQSGSNIHTRVFLGICMYHQAARVPEAANGGLVNNTAASSSLALLCQLQPSLSNPPEPAASIF